jgi:cellulose synthase/poly-beta-1,6-N-acetylglucosamine synthase-like glycosyltransferase
MIVYAILVLVLTLLYVFLFLFYLVGWMLLPEFTKRNAATSTKCSVIVAARNEDHHIGDLLKDLLAQNYPASHFDVFVVDDFSEDNMAGVVKSFAGSNIHLLSLHEVVRDVSASASYKKKALEYGIACSAGELIITTDADCRMGAEWLETIVNYYEVNRPAMIVAQVLFSKGKNFFERWQSLDFTGLMGITGASLYWNFPVLCNGANLAFTRQAFEEAGGYTGIDQVSSGDDLLLMHKISKQRKAAVQYLKSRDAVVYTYAQPTLSQFLAQRFRWTSKSRHYTDVKIKVNLLLVYLFNLALLVTFLLAWFHPFYLGLFLFSFFGKMIVEFAFLSQVTAFFNSRKLLWLFLPAQVLHISYIVIVGALGNFIKPNWKGRKIR